MNEELIEKLTPHFAETLASTKFYDQETITYINYLLCARSNIYSGVRKYIKECEKFDNKKEFYKHFKTLANYQNFMDSLFYMVKFNFSYNELKELAISQPNSKNLLKAYAVLAYAYKSNNVLYSQLFDELKQSENDLDYEICTENRYNEELTV